MRFGVGCQGPGGCDGLPLTEFMPTVGMPRQIEDHRQSPQMGPANSVIAQVYTGSKLLSPRIKVISVCSHQRWSVLVMMEQWAWSQGWQPCDGGGYLTLRLWSLLLRWWGGFHPGRGNVPSHLPSRSWWIAWLGHHLQVSCTGTWPLHTERCSTDSVIRAFPR